MQNAASVAPAVWDGGIVWEVSGKPISVRLSRDVVDRLGIAVQEGFKSLPRRGLETGGLLIGTKRESGNRVVVDVNDFEPVESEHAAGPSYLLSDADRRLLAARIAAREGGKSNSIVGFYRSHTRRDFAITMEDAALFSTYFRKASDVFLLIKSNDGGPPTAGFIIREGGKVLSDRPYVQFPLDRTAITAAVREIPVLSLQTSLTTARLGPPQAVQAVQPMAPPPATRMVRLPIWLATAMALALALSVPFGIRRLISGSIPAKPGRSLDLNVIKTGDSLRLSWERQAALHAGQAVLWIKDGQQEQKFELDAKQLSEGSVAYWPRDGDVTFRLDLQTPGGNVTESVRAIGGPSKVLLAVPASAAAEVASSPAVDIAPSPAVDTAPSPAVDVAASAAVGVTPSAAVGASTSPAVVAAIPRAVPSPDAVPTSTAGPSPNPPRRNRRGTASREISRAFALPQPEPDRSMPALAALPDPPTIQPMVALPLEHSKEVLERIATANSMGPGADPSLRVIVEPVSGSRLGRNIPLIGKRYARADYVPPVPIRNAAVPAPPHRKVAQGVNIDVKVYINPSGKVEYSEVLSKVAKTDGDLASLAVFAARRWEFIPARAGKDTVPGEVILHYQFAPVAGAGRN